MSDQESREEDRPELPIERGFPVERVNEIVEKEGRAKQHYRPIYTMHKWWARRPGSLFRALTLYSLLDGRTTVDDVDVYEPGEASRAGTDGTSAEALVEAIDDVTMENPESLWDYYVRDVRIENKKILDPFAGGGTSLVEASRFGVESLGIDLNPVAWFVNKKQLEAWQTPVEEIEDAFDGIADRIREELLQYYRTPCPRGDHRADVMYTFWVKELDCESCGHTVSLFKDYRLAAGRYEDDDGHHVLCPDCEQLLLVEDWRSECRCDGTVNGTECGHRFVPREGNVSRGRYTCPDCGETASIADGVTERNGFDLRPYAVEYYCTHCEEGASSRSEYKGYKPIDEYDRELVASAVEEWESSDGRRYVPDGEIVPGWYTASSRFDGSAPGAHDIFEHGYEKWTDLYHPRQLLCLSTLLAEIDAVEDRSVREYLLLAFSDSLMFQNTFSIYNVSANKIEGIFRLNAYVPQTEIVENNVWGTKAGRGTFSNTVEKMLSGVEYAMAPTERYVDGEGETRATAPFAQSIGKTGRIQRGDMRSIAAEDEFDAVVTDPPYYHNVMYAELADYFYAWQRLLLSDRYEEFERENTPRAESIVTNPAADKTVDDFETEMAEAFDTVHTALKADGVLMFTYHHSDEESWGELLESLCESGFEVTATYPIHSDLSKFIEARETATFDVVIVARPVTERAPITWNALRRRIVRSARRTRETLERTRSLSGGDVGVVEMGNCFQAYSRHHGEIRGSRVEMTAKEVVAETYGIIRDEHRGVADVYLDLLEEGNPGAADLDEHLGRSDATEGSLRERGLCRVNGTDVTLCDWQDDRRRAYVRSRAQARDDQLTPLDRAHFLRDRYERDPPGTARPGGRESDELRELCEDLAVVTGDETYLDMLGVDATLSDLAE